MSMVTGQGLLELAILLSVVTLHGRVFVACPMCQQHPTATVMRPFRSSSGWDRRDCHPHRVLIAFAGTRLFGRSGEERSGVVKV